MTFNLLTWSHVAAAGPAWCGGKGFNLARLDQIGFVIPKGGVLSCEGYRALIATAEIARLIDQVGALSSDALMATDQPLLTQLRGAILDAPLPAAFTATLADFLAQQQLTDKALAVRSSATQEDGEQASFAGMHDSVLNVCGQVAIEQAIRYCFASLWRSRAILYRRKMQIADAQVACAVVINDMVQAASAGVAFSCDPASGRRDVVVIHANFGLGESVVAGAVDPDQYRLHRFSNTLIDKHIGQKQRICQAKAGGGTAWLAADNSRNACLEDAQIQALAQLCDRVLHALGQGEQHQDIEWAFDGSQFVLLQARPVTALRRVTCAAISAQADIWSNGNFRDALPMVMPHLMREACDYHLNNILHRNFEGVYPLDPALRFARQFQGRFYCNAGLLQWLWFDAVGFAPEQMNISLGGHQPLISIDHQYRHGLGNRLRRLWRGLKFFKLLGHYRQRAERIVGEQTAFAEQARQVDYQALSTQGLVDALALLERRMVDSSRDFIMLTAQSGALFMLVQTLEKYVGERAYALANALMAGVADITSAEHGHQLQALAQQLQQDTALLDIINSDSFQPRQWQSQLPAQAPFTKAFAQFIAQYGHRAVYEADLSRARWREDPRYLFDCIKGNLNWAQAAPPQAQNESAWHEIRQCIPRYLYGYIRRQVNMAARGAALKELGKSSYIGLMEPLRMALLVIGERLVQGQQLEAATDIFHCARAEILAVLQQSWDGRALPRLVAERKAMQQAQAQLPAPDLIFDDTPQQTATQADSSGAGWHGIGVATGVASGIACLIDTPEAGHRLSPGGVLVAPSTDPAWTPLFLKACAIVMETGGYLSHGAIVAREYGIPAVVNVRGAMRLISAGAVIEVDGQRGRVRQQ